MLGPGCACTALGERGKIVPFPGGLRGGGASGNLVATPFGAWEIGAPSKGPVAEPGTNGAAVSTAPGISCHVGNCRETMTPGPPTPPKPEAVWSRLRTFVTRSLDRAVDGQSGKIASGLAADGSMNSNPLERMPATESAPKATVKRITSPSRFRKGV